MSWYFGISMKNLKLMFLIFSGQRNRTKVKCGFGPQKNNTNSYNGLFMLFKCLTLVVVDLIFYRFVSAVSMMDLNME